MKNEKECEKKKRPQPDLKEFKFYLEIRFVRIVKVIKSYFYISDKRRS